MKVRCARPSDVTRIHALIVELAVYEKQENEVLNTVDNLQRDIFEKKFCEAIVLENKGEVIGFAIFYVSYSTWKGPCLYLEDLYVIESMRRNNAGGKLFDYLVKLAKEREYARMDWQVLDWNEPAIKFYQKRGADLDEEWLNGRLYFRK